MTSRKILADLNRFIGTPLGTGDLKKMLGTSKPNIVLTTQMQQMHSAEELFPDGVDYCIIFLATNTPMSGHWEVCFKNITGFYFFDSYGYSPNGLLREMKQNGQDLFGQDESLMRLILNSSWYRTGKCWYNAYHYQDDDTRVQTCGRYVLFAIAMNKLYKHKGLTIYDIYLALYGINQEVLDSDNYDEIISALVNHRNVQ